MGVAIELTKAFLDAQGMRYDATDDGEALIIGMGLKNLKGVRIFVVFDSESSVALRIMDLIRVPENKKTAMYKACSQMNAAYRWVKFYVSSRDNTVQVEDDAVIQPENCGEEVFELVLRMSSIVDEAYPTFMKALWAD